jgi:hypothetical protein
VKTRVAANEPATEIAQDVAKRMPPSVDAGMPGGRAALPEGTLPTTYLGPQGDEQRDPPAGAPSAVPPSPVVTSELPAGPTDAAPLDA